MTNVAEYVTGTPLLLLPWSVRVTSTCGRILTGLRIEGSDGCASSIMALIKLNSIRISFGRFR